MRVALDTNRYVDLCKGLVEMVALLEETEAVAGRRLLAERYEALLTRSRGIRLVEVSHDQLRAAAQLRAATSVKTPDAFQLVAAIGGGCTTFLTNDRRLPPVPGLRILELASYVK